MATPERLADPAIQDYLAAKAVVVLGTVDADGAPRVTPMWFVHDAAVIVMVTRAGTRKARDLEREPRVALVAESGDRVDIRRVTIAGCAETVRDPAEQQRWAERLMAKYDPHVEAMWGGRRMPPDRVMLRIVPRVLASAGLSKDRR